MIKMYRAGVSKGSNLYPLKRSQLTSMIL